MKKFTFFVVMLLFFCSVLNAQVGINSDNSAPDNSAMLDVKSTSKGFLPPRVALTAADVAGPVTAPVAGLFVYNTATSGTAPNNVVPGYYCWNGTRWVAAIVPQGTNSGDMLYWNGTQWVSIAVGVNGQVLTLNNGVPTWGGNQLPIVSTSQVTGITATTATSGGNVTSDGGATVTARGVCWSTSSGPVATGSHTTDAGTTGSYTSTLTGLTAGIPYYIRAYATNSVGTGYGAEMSFTIFTCGASITINHLASDGVGAVDKTVTYATVNNIPGAPTKCWITSNLGADHQATAVSDATEPSAGWYWQFNRKQGYKHDGTTRTPNTTWISTISESSDWTAANDPCTIELGTGWRIPTTTEWTNVDGTSGGNWTDWNGPWNSGLKLHAAGFLGYTAGGINNRGVHGYYWSSSQYSSTDGGYLSFNSSYSLWDSAKKANGYSLRCLKDN